MHSFFEEPSILSVYYFELNIFTQLSLFLWRCMFIFCLLLAFTVFGGLHMWRLEHKYYTEAGHLVILFSRIKSHQRQCINLFTNTKSECKGARCDILTEKREATTLTCCRGFTACFTKALQSRGCYFFFFLIICSACLFFSRLHYHCTVPPETPLNCSMSGPLGPASNTKKQFVHARVMPHR